MAALFGAPGVHGAEAAAGGGETTYIQEYRVKGAKQLGSEEIGEVVYPYLGPGRSADDVEGARAALEKAYQDKGYQTVSVEIPKQDVRGGVVFLQVNENTVGRLRVKGSRYFSLEQIRNGVPSLAEGTGMALLAAALLIVALGPRAVKR